MFHAEHRYSTIYINVHQNIKQITKEITLIDQTHFYLELNKETTTTPKSKCFRQQRSWLLLLIPILET